VITRRRVLIAVLALFLIGVGYIAWTLAGLPPVKYYLRYGLDPYCEPTGERVTYEGVEFVEIGPGVFRMGSTYLAKGGDWLGKLCAPLGLPWGTHPELSDEMPVHWVEFRQGFWIATTETTNAQYERYKPKNERSPHSKDNDMPVGNVSWDDARRYCSWLTKQSNRPIRLPSEAEWECACRAGSSGEFAHGNNEAMLAKYERFGLSWGSGARTVASRKPTPWGLYDMHGNVMEWCDDAYHYGDTYAGAPTDGSPRKDGGEEWEPGRPGRVWRGGNWFAPGAEFCRSACRGWQYPDYRGENLGFRPAFRNPE
jgi:formylglycine-generating enzyme required for sulfatase activity